MTKKPNPFESFLAEPAPEPTTPASIVGTATPAAARKRPGRPPKSEKDNVQTTTIRLDAEDHLAVRQLALRDKQTMNGLIFAALKAYCESRGVRLAGKANESTNS